MNTDLFHIPETPMLPLEAARQRLARAMEAEREAERIFEEQGSEALTLMQHTRDMRHEASRAVEVLERAALKGAKP